MILSPLALLALSAAAIHPTLDSIPNGCYPSVSPRIGSVTVAMSKQCAPLDATIVTDDKLTGDLAVQHVSLSNGAMLIIEGGDGCRLIQRDLMLGHWTVAELKAIDGVSAGPWLLSATLEVPEGSPIPDEWAPYGNAVERVPAGNCTAPEPTTTTTTPATTTTTTTTTAPVPDTPELTTTTAIPEPTTTTGPVPPQRLPDTGRNTMALLALGVVMILTGWLTKRRAQHLGE